MIRRAVLADVPRIVGMMQKFAARHLPYEIDPHDSAATMQALIEGHYVTVSRKGFFAATIQPDPLNRSRTIAREFLWWAEDGEGLGHARAFRRDVVADEIQWGCVPGMKAERFYSRIGSPCEVIYREIRNVS